MTFAQLLILFAAAGAGGLVNAIAGGGTLVTLPALIACGVPPLTANATSVVVFWPGLISAAWGYRSQLVTHHRTALAFGSAALVGGLIGACLLVSTPAPAFAKLLPFLMLFALVLVIAGPRLVSAVQARRAGGTSGEDALGRNSLIQMIAAVIVGYFNGGGGVVSMAALSLTGMRDMQVMNALRILSGITTSGIAVVALAAGGLVNWRYTPVMIAGAIVGGYVGTYLALRLSQQLLRRSIIAGGAVMISYVFAVAFP